MCHGWRQREKEREREREREREKEKDRLNFSQDKFSRRTASGAARYPLPSAESSHSHIFLVCICTSGFRGFPRNFTAAMIRPIPLEVSRPEIIVQSHSHNLTRPFALFMLSRCTSRAARSAEYIINVLLFFPITYRDLQGEDTRGFARPYDQGLHRSALASASAGTVFAITGQIAIVWHRGGVAPGIASQRITYSREPTITSCALTFSYARRRLSASRMQRPRRLTKRRRVTERPRVVSSEKPAARYRYRLIPER
ncbi:hypothetical protein DMN91_004873 [Ooceraea biroi]|uniref:Uncharacterized protein n=1 Tax=Ooceraea biroi TaxID=2015173 RepID=A0A3L8DQ87_OOCBI|nr:uncharacterized protein LOC105287775 [Ooceraea biroi]RLU22595.1 hypothetical protein DMN91_004873 [Ooceraea biroi]